DPVTLNLDPEDVAGRITGRTKAIMPVHLFGRPAANSELATLGVPIVEDAAQAFGAEGVATTGVASTFSFFPTKNLFALGGGGLVRGVLRHAAPPPACAGVSRLPRGRAPGDRAGVAGEPRAPDVGRDRRGEAGAGGGDDPRGVGGRGVPVISLPITRHRFWQ